MKFDATREQKLNALSIHGLGFRVYFTLRGLEIVILLAGGDKSSQTKDIQTAQELARQLKE